jgi:hypothetical protein
MAMPVIGAGTKMDQNAHQSQEPADELQYE